MKGRDAVGALCDCTALRKASRRVSQLYDAVLAPSGLKATQRAILAQVARAGATSVGQLAQALVMDPGALAHTLRPLVRDGLVAVGVDPGDRRVRRITLSPLGRDRLAASDALWDKAQRGFEAALGGAASETLRAAMRALVSDAFAASFAAGASGDRGGAGR